MVDLQKITKNGWILIQFAIFVALLVFISLFRSNRADEYKRSIRTLTEQRDSLRDVVNVRQQSIDSLSLIVDKTNKKFDTINYQNDVLKKKLNKYEKTITDVRYMSIDDNIILLTKQLSEEDRSQ